MPAILPIRRVHNCAIGQRDPRYDAAMTTAKMAKRKKVKSEKHCHTHPLECWFFDACVSFADVVAVSVADDYPRHLRNLSAKSWDHHDKGFGHSWDNVLQCQYRTFSKRDGVCKGNFFNSLSVVCLLVL